MESTMLSADFQVLIPETILKNLNLKAGQKFICLIKGGIINLIPQRDIQSVRGLLRGAKPDNYRDRTE